MTNLTIPEVRDELISLSHSISMGHYIPATLALKLLNLSEQLKRRPASSKSEVKSQRMTPSLARSIAAFAKTNPKLSQVEIAQRFGVNPGRVSEAINGKRK
jgi:hypothetical protein